MPDCSATGRIFLIYPKGSWNSSLVGSNTGASGGTVNSNSCADPFNLSLEGPLENPLALSPLDTIVSMISICHNKFIKQFLTKTVFILLYWLHFDDPNPHDVILFRQQRRFRPFMSTTKLPNRTEHQHTTTTKRDRRDREHYAFNLSSSPTILSPTGWHRKDNQNDQHKITMGTCILRIGTYTRSEIYGHFLTSKSIALHTLVS